MTLLQKNATATQIDEAEQLYFALFRRHIPDVLKQRFEHASRIMTEHVNTVNVAHYDKIIRAHTDLEALELAGRMFGKLSLLSLKIRLMIWIAETWPENRQFYVNDKNRNLLVGYAVCAFGTMRTIYKFIKGMVLLQRYGRI